MKQAISDILSQSIKKNFTVILAFSGGPDSVYLLNELKKHPFKVVIAHFNHELRGKESDADEKFSEKMAKKYKLDFETESFPIKAYAKKNGLSIEEAAREKRYAFLKNMRSKHKAAFILTAHHLDDNIETFMLNFIRGTGLKGLKSMQIKTGNILRPLLYTTKEEILKSIKKKKLKYRVDKSNEDTKFTRNALRINVMPELKKLQPKLSEVFLRNWEHITELSNYIDSTGDEWISKHQKNEFEIPLKEFFKLHPAIQKTVLQNIYKQLHGGVKGLSANMLNRAQKEILKKNTGKKVPFGKNMYLSITSKTFKCIPKKEPKKITKKKVKVPGKTTCSYGTIETDVLTKPPKNLKKGIFVDYAKVKTPLYIRSKKDGDKFTPFGMKGSKKLQDFFVDKKIPVHLRNQIPVLVDSNNNIIAIGSEAIANSYRISSKTTKILKIGFVLKRR